MSPLSMSMPSVLFLPVTYKSALEWVWCGTHTGMTSSNLQQEISGGKRLGEKYPAATTKSQETGGTSYKQNFFEFLSLKSVTLDYPKRLFIHLMLMIFPKGPVMVVPCNHEEADTRLLVHLAVRASKA